MDWYKIASQEYKEANELRYKYNDHLHLSNDPSCIIAAISKVQDKLDKKFVEIVHIALKRERQYTAIRAQYDMGTVCDTVERTIVPIEQPDPAIREECVETTRIAVNRRQQYEELRAEEM
jgi:hypothetical protein